MTLIIQNTGLAKIKQPKRKITPRSTVFIYLFKKPAYKDKSIGNRFWMDKLAESKKMIIMELDKLATSAHSYFKKPNGKADLGFDKWIALKDDEDMSFAYWAIHQLQWIAKNELGFTLDKIISQESLEVGYFNDMGEVEYRVLFHLEGNKKIVEENIYRSYESMFHEPVEFIRSKDYDIGQKCLL